MVILATVAPTAADSMGLPVFTVARALTEVPAFMRNQERAPVRSAALIMAAMSGAFRLVDGRVLAVVRTVVVSMAAAAVADGAR